MANTNGNSRTVVLTVYNDGTMIAAPELTGGDALQIAELIKRAVLSQPLVHPQTMPAPEPIPEPA